MFRIVIFTKTSDEKTPIAIFSIVCRLILIVVFFVDINNACTLGYVFDSPRLSVRILTKSTA